jgi:predicted ribosome quality control (RQC) complex YloA/Tae2 family protein
MFNPELRYLIAEDNEHNQAVVDKSVIENILDYGGIISTAILLTTIVFNRLSILTSILTPGEEWLELALIATSIGIFVLFKLIADFVLNDLNATFVNLYNQVEEKDNIIKQSENSIEKLEKTVSQLDNKAVQMERTIQDLNDKIEKLNDENDDLRRENNFLNDKLIDEIRQDDAEFAKLEARIKSSYITTELFEDRDNYYNNMKRETKMKSSKNKKLDDSYINDYVNNIDDYDNVVYA